MDEQKFQIDGFHCEACVKLATMKIKKIEGVHEVNVSVEGQASICAGRTISLEEVSAALDGLGYTVSIK